MVNGVKPASDGAITIIRAGRFVRRQTRESGFSYYDGPWSSLESLVTAHWDERAPGYRDGVVLVPVPPEGFYSAVVETGPGDEFKTVMESRRDGEAPAKVTVVVGKEKQPARKVDVVRCSAETLAEDGGRETDADWEIVSIDASPIDGPTPMRPLTMARNERHLTGGTKATYSKDEYVDAILFWSKHAMVAPVEWQPEVGLPMRSFPYSSHGGLSGCS